MRRLLVASLGLAVAMAAHAESKCSAQGVMGGKKFVMSHCAISYYDDQHSVTIWFSESPISADEAHNFEASAYAPDREATGKPRTTLHLAFCPGGGKAAPRPDAVLSVEFWMNHADSPMLGRQWVLEPHKDKVFKVERLSGDLKLGGRLAGHVTGGKTSDGLPYSWTSNSTFRYRTSPPWPVLTAACTTESVTEEACLPPLRQVEPLLRAGGRRFFLDRLRSQQDGSARARRAACEIRIYAA